NANLSFAGSRAHRVRLAIAQVDKNLAFDHATVADEIDMSGVRVGGFLLIRSETLLAYVNLLNAKADKEFDIASATISGQLNMDRLQVSGLLSINKTSLNGIALRDAQVGQLNLDSSKVAATLDCSGMDVGGDASLVGSEFFGLVYCPGARIKGD